MGRAVITAMVYFAASGAFAHDYGPDQLTCIAYMEADAVHDAAVETAKSEAKLDWKAADANARAAYEAKLNKAKDDTSLKLRAAAELEAERINGREVVEAGLQLTLAQLDALRTKAYLAANVGLTSDYPSVMAKLIRGQRARCRELFEGR